MSIPPESIRTPEIGPETQVESGPITPEINKPTAVYSLRPVDRGGSLVRKKVFKLNADCDTIWTGVKRNRIYYSAILNCLFFPVDIMSVTVDRPPENPAVSYSIDGQDLGFLIINPGEQAVLMLKPEVPVGSRVRGFMVKRIV